MPYAPNPAAPLCLEDAPPSEEQLRTWLARAHVAGHIAMLDNGQVLVVARRTKTGLVLPEPVIVTVDLDPVMLLAANVIEQTFRRRAEARGLAPQVAS